LLRDPTDDDVVPIVEELQRRLPNVTAASQGQGEYARDGEDGEENGAFCEIIDSKKIKFFS
jgi:magnesium transporter